MSGPVKVYAAIHDGETKIQIPVFDVQGRCYSAVMVPLARSEERLMSHFQKYKIRHELGETIELAVAECEKWIKENLWEDVDVLEDREP